MSRKKIIILSSVFLFIAVIAFVVYFLAIYRAESSLQKLVKNQSKGKLFLKVEKVDLDILDLRFDFQHLEIRSIDSSNTLSGYHLKADNITFSVHSLISVLAGKNVIIDSVIINSPLIEVIKYNKGPKRKISLPDEMSKVYHSLEKILEVLNLNYLHIGNAKFRVFDRMKPDGRPLQVSNINLTIDNVTKANKAAEKKFLFADRILLEIYNENLILPDGLHGISFKKLWLGTRSRMLKLDSCYVYGKSSDSSSTSFSFSIDSLRILNFDFNRLAKDNTIKFDSALCINPQIYLNLHPKAKEKKSVLNTRVIINKDSIDEKLTKMLGNLDIGYLAVKNAAVNIVSKKNSKTNTFNSKSSNFSISGLVVDAKNEVPLQVKEIKFDVHDYTGYSPDSMHMIQFNDVIIQENKIRLNDFRILPTKRNKDPERKLIKMKVFELDDINWLALLYEHRIIAGHASLIQPEADLIIHQQNKKQEGKEKKNPFSILTKIQDKIKIGHLFVEDGNVKLKVLNGPSVSMNNCYLGINVEQLFNSENEFRLIDALDTLSFSKGEFRNSGSQFTLAGGKYSKIKSALYFNQISERKTDKSQLVTIDKVKLGGIILNSPEDISMDELSWAKARIDIETEALKKSENTNTKPDSDYKFKLNRINGGPTQLSIKTQGIEASTVLNHISTGEIIVASGQKPSVKGLYIDGQSINLDQQDKLHGSFDQFHVADNQLSELSNVTVRLPVNGETATVFIPRLTFSVDIHSSLNGKIKADFIELSQPVISFDSKQESVAYTTQTAKKVSGLPDMQINRITINQPELVNLPAEMQSKMQFSPGNSRIDLIGIHSESNELKIDSLSLSALKPSFKTSKIQLKPGDNSKIDLSVTNIMFKPSKTGDKSKWALKLNALKFADLRMDTYQNDTLKQTIVLGSMNIGNIFLNDSLMANTDELVRANNLFYLKNGSISLKNSKTSLDVYNLSLVKSSNTLSLDSLNFSPVMDRDSFMKTKEFQSTYLKFHSGSIKVNGIDFARLLKDTLFYSPKIILSDFHLLAYKDKRLPFRHGIVKPMLTDMLLNIKPKLQVDSVIFKKGLIEYEEFNDKTQQFGRIKLSKIKGAIADVKTFDPLPDDSLKFNMYARLIDTADIRLKYKQSYSDSLSGFNLKIIVSSFNLTALNPILRPFASAELKSGNLDTIRMSAIGRKYIAYGIMKMYYYDLNAQMLSKGDSSAKNIVTKSVSFFANRLVHTKNRRGTGDVFAERDPEKGFVNYWVKIVVGGVLTNSGVRTDKKQQRKYKRALNNHAVPPIPDIPVDY